MHLLANFLRKRLQVCAFFHNFVAESKVQNF